MEDFDKVIVEAENVLAESEKFLRQYKSPTYQRKLKRLYSNRRAIKKRVRKQEEQLAMSLASLKKSADISKEVSLLESDMEWFP